MPRRRRPAVRRLSLLLCACDPGGSTGPRPEPSPGPTSEPDVAWLHANAVPFATTVPGGDYADLEALRAIVGDARIVALGEATHGTAEFFTVKHRILEFLVKEMGFTALGMEAAWAESHDVDAFVRTGAGDDEVLLSNLYFWTWNTAEVRDMIRWMRRHNQAAGDGSLVGFHGFDMQFSRAAMDRVEAFLAGVDPAAADSAATLYACFRNFQDAPRGGRATDYRAQPASTRAHCRAGVHAAYGLVEQGRTAWAAAAGEDAYERALRAARVVVQNEDARSVLSTPEGYGLRDLYMAENAAWLLERAGPGARIVLWAHNGHIARREGWMGWHLDRAFGDEYRPIGFAFHGGSFNAFEHLGNGEFGPLGPQEAPPARADSYGHAFHRLGMPHFLLDVRPLAGDLPAEAAWLRGPRPLRLIGATFSAQLNNDYYHATRIADDYDAVVFIDRMSPTRLLPFRWE